MRRMPELPEVETTVRGLESIMVGRSLDRVEVRRPDLRRPFPADLGQRLTGATVTSLSRRAKFGLIGTDRGDTLVFHLGMSGRWRIDPEELDAHDHLLIDVSGGARLALNDARRFGSVDLVGTADLADFAPLKTLGPEPRELTTGQLHKRLLGREAPIKLLLLDQTIVAGLGNIYVCEALHRAGIHPRRPGGRVSLKRLERLVEAVRAVLDEAIAAGGSTLRDFVSPTGKLGYFSKSFAVYDRESFACRCGGTIRRLVQGGRSTFYCPRCQH